MTNIIDNLIIIPCSQEIVKYGLDKENKSIRGFICNEKSKQNNISINLDKKMDRHTTNVCINDKSNEIPLCTYNNSLQFIKGKVTDCSTSEFWSQFIEYINSVEGIVKRNFYLVTHHNRIKETILSEILDIKTRRHFANCSCLRIFYKNNNWNFEIVYKGEPDKLIYDYFNVGVWNELTPGIINLKNNSIVTQLNNIKNKNTDIFLIRHGNSCHNKPLILTKQNISSFVNRMSDSPLTPLGIYQIYQLKKFLIEKQLLKENSELNTNIFCASYLNRSQHSVLQLVPDIEKYKKLSNLNKFFGKQSITRISKRINKDEAIRKLNEFNIKLNGTNIQQDLNLIYDKFISGSCVSLELSRKYNVIY